MDAAEPVAEVRPADAVPLEEGTGRVVVGVLRVEPECPEVEVEDGLGVRLGQGTHLGAGSVLTG